MLLKNPTHLFIRHKSIDTFTINKTIIYIHIHMINIYNNMNKQMNKTQLYDNMRNNKQ